MFEFIVKCAVAATSAVCVMVAKKILDNQKSGYQQARLAAKARYDEVAARFSKKAVTVMAELDVMDDADAILDVVSMDTVNGAPLVCAYRLSRVVRAAMTNPCKNRANILVASDKLRKLMDERNMRDHQKLAVFNLALVMVFIRDKRELEAEMLEDLVSPTWRAAKRVAE